MSLKIHVAAGEHIIINGALLQVVESCHLVFINNASFLTQRHIMPAAAANTPARRIYFAIQSAYLAQEEERTALLERVDALIRDFQEATVMESIKRTLQTIKDHVDNQQHYQALKLTTIVIRHEEKVLNLDPWQKPKPRPPGA